MAAVAPQPAMTTIQLAVPPGAQPGQLIQAQVNGQNIQAQIPPGLQPGATFAVQIPAATQQANDPAALAAYDALLAGAGRLTFPLHFEYDPFNNQGTETVTGFLDVEADDRAAFRVKLDSGNWETARQSYGKYEAQIVLGGGVVQTVSSAGGPPLKGMRWSGTRLPDPVASQSMDRGEALTVQVKRTNREEVVHLTRGGGGGLSLVGPPEPPEPVCCCAGAPAHYVAYDRAGAPLGGAQLVIPALISCRGDPRLQRQWLDLGSTPVASRRDLVAAVVTTLVGHRLTPRVVAHGGS